MSAAGDGDNNVPDTCANCGKGEDNGKSLKACAACKLVKYCNRECQIAHRPQHKKECKRRAAELHEEALFKEPPPTEDCPICMVRLPLLHTGHTYQSCCGKVICCGCIFAPRYDHEGNVVDNQKCPFCRTPVPETYEEVIERLNKRVEAGDAAAISNLGGYYFDGKYGLPQDYDKALELFHQAGELGHALAYNNIGYSYINGWGVESDKKKARYYYELAAMSGCVEARHNLGATEGQAFNNDRAIRHFMIAVKDGSNDSLLTIKKMVMFGYATKDDYTKALESYQAYLDEIKSDQRDKAAAADEDYKYMKCV